MQKAFDSVSHTILLNKLSHYGIRGQPLNWIKNYLSNRKQYTVCNNKKSNLHPLPQYGVPQGSVLGPLLFLIYINDFANCTKIDCKPKLFADDTNIFIAHDSNTKLKQDMTLVMEDINKWLSVNQLSLNIEKTCFTIFKRKNKVIPNFLNTITFNNCTINRVKCTKYLGVYLDENLSWDTHIRELENSLRKTNNAFKIIKHQVP